MRTVLDTISTGALVLIAAICVSDFIPRQQPRRSLPSHEASLRNTPRLGSPTAPVILLIFSDFECPYCARLAVDVVPTLKTRYVDTGRMQMAFRHFFNQESHPLAPQLAETAVCAAAQGRFWEMHDRLFAQPHPIEPAGLNQVRRGFGGDTDALERCLDTNSFSQFAEDRREAQQLGVTSTPTSFVGKMTLNGLLRVTAVIEGSQPLATFSNAIEQR